MEIREYKTIYEDRFGIEEAVFQSDGSFLEIELRGVEFEGSCVESLEGKKCKQKFDFIDLIDSDIVGDLTNCNFKVEIPIKLMSDQSEMIKPLRANIQISESPGSDYGLFFGIARFSKPCCKLKTTWIL